MTRIDAIDAQARVKAGALLIDVRTPAERKALKIPDSKSMPLDQLSTQWQTLPTDRELICQCASGMRSAQAAFAAFVNPITT